MWVRNSLMNMFLPSSNTTFTTECLMRLACLLGVGPVSSPDSGLLLVLVLFLQGVGRRKGGGGEKDRGGGP